LNSLEGFTEITHNDTGLSNVVGADGGLGAHKCFTNVNFWKHCAITKSQLPIKIFDPIIPASSDFMNWGKTLRRRVLKLKRERGRYITMLFKETDVNEPELWVVDNLNSLTVA
jgi:hypothetical protein